MIYNFVAAVDGSRPAPGAGETGWASECWGRDTKAQEMRCRPTRHSICMRACVRTIVERERKEKIKRRHDRAYQKRNNAMRADQTVGVWERDDCWAREIEIKNGFPLRKRVPPHRHRRRHSHHHQLTVRRRRSLRQYRRWDRPARP